MKQTGVAASKVPAAPWVPSVLGAAVLPCDDFSDDGELVSLHYSGVDLTGRQVEVLDVEKCAFDTCRLAGGRLGRAAFIDSTFTGCDLANLTARDCSLLRVAIRNSRLTGLSWAGGAMKDVSLESCRADLASFRFCRFGAVRFRDCDLRQADFQEADLRGAVFENCDLGGAQFSHAQLAGTRFSGCVLAGIGGVTSLRGAVIAARDMADLAFSLAAALGIQIED